MDFNTAFREALKRSGLSIEEVAIRVGVRANSVERWKGGSRTPSGPIWQLLRDRLPFFADLIDGKAA